MVHQEMLEQRAEGLDVAGLNGLEMAIVHLDPPGRPTRAFLDVYFYNELGVADILDTTDPPAILFPILGGHHRRAGGEGGQVQVVAIAPGSEVTDLTAGAENRALRLTVEPVGDYSTYRLTIQFTGIDPVFSELPFKFRPGCFSSECVARGRGEPRPATDPAIDYTAKDYASFRHTLIAAMGRRMPGWTPTSEADLAQTLIDYMAAAADELSDYQDRVVNERALATSRSRVSLARHARLMDYHVHQGNQAATWVVLEMEAGADRALEPGHVVTTTDGAQIYDLEDEEPIQPQLIALANGLRLYTWSDARPGLEVGATSAELSLLGSGEPPTDANLAAARARGDRLAQLINEGKLTRLVIWQALDPATGRAAGRDLRERQLLRLVIPAVVDGDPFTREPFLRVTWRAEDALEQAYCATVFPPGGSAIGGVSLMSGNLVRAHHGRRRSMRFLPPGEAPLIAGEGNWRASRWGAICRLPADARLLYRHAPPGSVAEPPTSTAEVTVVTLASSEAWHERISLVHSDGDEPHFAVETDELRRSAIRFGNGINGSELPDGASVEISWQSGDPLAGNVGVEAIARSDHPGVARCWNPFDVTSAREPEPAEQVIRRAPEAYRAVQLRCVTLRDIVDRAEEVEGVARAAARYTWTGSWTAVQLVIDPAGAEILEDDLRQRVADHMAPLMLIGDDLEIRAPRYVPLHIQLDVCLRPDYWPEDVRSAIEEELTDGYTADGRAGLFHPDRWTFGQPLHASEVIGRVQRVDGVAHVVAVDLQRYREPTPGPSDRIEVQAFEIIQVHNDPSDLERGLIEIVNLRGGRG